METGIGLVKIASNNLFLVFINGVGRLISLDCQYIIRVAEESCSNCSLLPKSDSVKLLYFIHVQWITVDCGYFHRHFCAQQ